MRKRLRKKLHRNERPYIDLDLIIDFVPRISPIEYKEVIIESKEDSTNHPGHRIGDTVLIPISPSYKPYNPPT